MITPRGGLKFQGLTPKELRLNKGPNQQYTRRLNNKEKEKVLKNKEFAFRLIKQVAWKIQEENLEKQWLKNLYKKENLDEKRGKQLLNQILHNNIDVNCGDSLLQNQEVNNDLELFVNRLKMVFNLENYSDKKDNKFKGIDRLKHIIRENLFLFKRSCLLFFNFKII